MSKRRVRIIVVQAVVVGAGLLVVYLTLLRPEEHRPLFGVGTTSGREEVAQSPGGEQAQPGGGGAGATASGQRRGAHSRHGESARQHGGGGGGTRGGRAGGAASAVSGAAVGEAAALPIPTREGAQGGVTPSDEQYEDTVSRLFGNL